MSTTIKTDKLKNIWKYPRGTAIILENKQYWFMDRDAEIGVRLFDGYNIVYAEDILDEVVDDFEEYELALFSLIQKDVEMLRLGTEVYVLTLLEDVSVNMPSIVEELIKLSVVSAMVRTATLPVDTKEDK